MKILETRVYRGPNLYALRPVIRLKMDLLELEQFFVEVAERRQR